MYNNNNTLLSRPRVPCFGAMSLCSVTTAQRTNLFQFLLISYSFFFALGRTAT